MNSTCGRSSPARTWCITVVPSISGSRSRCTPSRLTSPPLEAVRGLAADLVQLVQEDDAVLLGTASTASLGQRLVVQHAGPPPPRMQQRAGHPAHCQLAASGAGRPNIVLAHHLAEIDHAPSGRPACPAHRTCRIAVPSRHPPARNLDLPVLQLAGPQSCGGSCHPRMLAGRAFAHQRGPITRVLRRRPRPWPPPPSRCCSRSQGQRLTSTRSRTMRIHIPPDIADLGELRRLHLDERRLRQLRQPPRDLGLAARRSARSSGCSSAPPPPAIPSGSCCRRQRLRKRDGHGALGVLLADDEAVELGNDLARGRDGDFGHMRFHTSGLRLV